MEEMISIEELIKIIKQNVIIDCYLCKGENEDCPYCNGTGITSTERINEYWREQYLRH